MYIRFSGLQTKKLIDREITETIILENCNLQKGDLLPIMIDNTVLSDFQCRITGVRKASVDEITCYDLRSMGFKDFNEFRQYLKWFHGLEEEQLFYIIFFELYSRKL